MIPTTARIGVLGGGPAGIGAAWYLRKQGYQQVTVLERSDQVGGKARTIHVDGNTVDLGALDVASNYANVRRIAEELDAPTRRTARLGMMDLRTGVASSSLKGLTAGAGPITVLRAMLGYFWAVGWTYDDFTEAPGLTDCPADLAVTMGEWMDRRGMQCLRPLFDYVCTGFGYGPLDAIPAAYLLRFVDGGDFMDMVSVDLGLREWPRNFTKGYNNLFLMMARTLPDVRLNVRVSRIERAPGTAAPVSVHLDGGAEPLVFDHLIVACRLDGTLGDLIVDLAPDLRALFAKVRYQPYATAVCRTSGIPWIALGVSPLPDPGRTYCMIQPWQGGNATAFYIMNPEHLPAERIHQNIRADLAAIRTFDGQPCRFEVHDLVEFVQWDYFPHFRAEDIAAGAYDRLDAQQGRDNTYFTGGLLGFETIHNTLAHAESIVTRFFQPR